MSFSLPTAKRSYYDFIELAEFHPDEPELALEAYQNATLICEGQLAIHDPDFCNKKLILIHMEMGHLFQNIQRHAEALKEFEIAEKKLTDNYQKNF